MAIEGFRDASLFVPEESLRGNAEIPRKIPRIGRYLRLDMTLEWQIYPAKQYFRDQHCTHRPPGASQHHKMMSLTASVCCSTL